MTPRFHHYWDSFCSIKTRFALEEKGVDFEAVFVDLLAFEQLRPAYLALNPNGVVPTLEHHGRAIVESTVINEYIDEAFDGPPLLPADPAPRARARVWVKLEDDRAHEAMRAPTFNLMIKPMIAALGDEEVERIAASHPQPRIGEYWKNTVRTPIDHEAVDRAMDVVREICARIDAALGEGGPWLAGEDFSLAECAFAPMIDRVEHLGFGAVFDDYPAMGAWIARIKARPAYGRAIPPEDARLWAPGRES